MKSKRLKIFIYVIVILVLAISLTFGIHLFKKSLINSGYGDSPNSANLYAEDVTMVQLIATPERYDGKLIRVKGVGNLEFERNCISLSKDDIKYGTGNSIWIELGARAISYEEAKKYNGEYVIVEGVFDKDDLGHLNSFRGSIKDINRYELWDAHLTTRSMITQELDKTYSYEIIDYNGRVLASEKGLSRQPKREYVNTDVIGISIQAGTGIFTKQTTYFDLENSRVSETYFGVLATSRNCVIYANYDNESGERSIVVQDIFDKSEYLETYELKDVSPVAADFTVECIINDDGNATVTYLAGDDYTETDITIVLP